MVNGGAAWTYGWYWFAPVGGTEESILDRPGKKKFNQDDRRVRPFHHRA